MTNIMHPTARGHIRHGRKPTTLYQCYQKMPKNVVKMYKLQISHFLTHIFGRNHKKRRWVRIPMRSFVMQPLNGLYLLIRYVTVISQILYYFSWKSQPIQAFEHSSFQNMINVAAHATNGVKIPDRRQTWQGIINSFKRQLMALRDRLNVRKLTGILNFLKSNVLLRVIRQREK